VDGGHALLVLLLVVNAAQAAAAPAAFMIEEVTQVEDELEAAIESW
jgi:hypothetical protein